MNFEIYQADLALCRKKLETLREHLELYTRGTELTQRMVDALEVICNSEDSVYELAEQLPLPNLMPAGKHLTIEYIRKPHVQVIEEILREHGPLHVTDIVRYGRANGIPFRGTKKPEQLARDKLYNSKRFKLLGNNVWGLKPDYNSNGHNGFHPVKSPATSIQIA